MIRTAIAMVAAAAIVAVTRPVDAVAQTTPADAAAVSAYIDTLESLHIEAAAIAERVFDRYRAVDAFRRGAIDEAGLDERFERGSETIRADIDANFQRLKRNAKPIITEDKQRNRHILAFQLSIASMTDLSRAVVSLTGKLRAAALAGDDAAYERIEADVFDHWSALYSFRNVYLNTLLLDIARDDPRYGIVRAGGGIAEAGITTYEILADSLRDDAFDIAAYDRAVETSLSLIERGLSATGAALADPAWPGASADESAAARAARRERGMALAERYADGARATAAAIRRDVASLRATADGAAVLSGAEMRDAVHALHRDIDRTLSGALELDPVRRAFDRLVRAGGAQ